MPSQSDAAVIAVTGANGFVGARVCEVLAERGAQVRAVVRRPGTAPVGAGIEELVGDFTDPQFAETIAAGATSVVTTVHPMGSDRAGQHRIGVEGTTTLARAAAAAGVVRFIHISTAAVYDRSPGVGDVDEASALVGDDANDYGVTKRDADLALAEINGITRVIVRPPAILGPGPTSTWNTLRPAAIRDDESERHTIAAQTFAWIHVDDLAALTADLATGRIPDADRVQSGPVAGECVAANVSGTAPATLRDYVTTVTDALGVAPVWEDGPAWTGQILSDRAEGWGWAPEVSLEQALTELAAALTAGT